MVFNDNVVPVLALHIETAEFQRVKVKNGFVSQVINMLVRLFLDIGMDSIDLGIIQEPGVGDIMGRSLMTKLDDGAACRCLKPHFQFCGRKAQLFEFGGLRVFKQYRIFSGLDNVGQELLNKRAIRFCLYRFL